MITDGSHRFILRNGRFLKKILFLCRNTFHDDELSSPTPVVDETPQPILNTNVNDPQLHIDAPGIDEPAYRIALRASTFPQEEFGLSTKFIPSTSSVPLEIGLVTRRSSRERAPLPIPQKLFNACMNRTYHDS